MAFFEEETTPSDSLSLGKRRLVGEGAGEDTLSAIQLKIVKTTFLEILKKIIHTHLPGIVSGFKLASWTVAMKS